MAARIARRRSPVSLDVAHASALMLARRIDTAIGQVCCDGATLPDVGRAAGCTLASLASWRSGELVPDSRAMESLASALGVTVSYLSLGWKAGATRAAGPAVALLVAENRRHREKERKQTNGDKAIGSRTGEPSSQGDGGGDQESQTAAQPALHGGSGDS